MLFRSDHGATDFFAKPINWKLLGYRIRYILRASRTVEQLAHSESALANAQRLAHLGSWEWRPHTNTTQRSDEYYRIYGMHKERVSPHQCLLFCRRFMPKTKSASKRF